MKERQFAPLDDDDEGAPPLFHSLTSSLTSSRALETTKRTGNKTQSFANYLQDPLIRTILLSNDIVLSESLFCC